MIGDLLDALGMAGQGAYHLMAQAGTARAPWAVTTVVSCLPVLVLAMGTTLAHMLRADAATVDALNSQSSPRSGLQSAAWSGEDQAGPGCGQREAGRPQSTSRDQSGPAPEPHQGRAITGPGMQPAQAQVEQARTLARRLAAAGRPVSRRALRNGGVAGSNAALNALARMINAEPPGLTPSTRRPAAGR